MSTQFYNPERRWRKYIWRPIRHCTRLLPAAVDMLVDSVYELPIVPRLVSKAPHLVNRRRILPPELLDLIVAYYDGDVSTLLACSLVCHAWNAVCRRRLGISIGPRKRSLALGRLLHSPYETFSKNVRQVILKEDRKGDLSQHRRVLRLLSIKGFDIKRIAVTHGSQFAPFLRRYYPNIIEISFRVDPLDFYDKTQVHDVRPLLSQLSSFQHLQSLSFETFAYTMLGLPPEAALLSVSRLHLSGKWWCVELMRWLQACCTNLQTLDFCIQYPLDVATTASFFRANCHTLRHITLSISGDSSLIRLDMLQHLVSLRLSLISLDDSFYIDVSVDAAVGTVRSLNPSHPPTTVVVCWSESAEVSFSDTHYAAFNSALVDVLGLTLVLQSPHAVSYQLS